MEQARIAPPPPQPTHEARAAQRKPQAPQDGAQAGGPDAGFAALLAGLGGAGDNLLDAALPALDELPGAAALLAQALPTPPLAPAADAADAVSAMLAGWAKPGLDTLVGQTAQLDGAAEAAVVNGTPTTGLPFAGRGARAALSGAAQGLGAPGGADAVDAAGAGIGAGTGVVRAGHAAQHAGQMGPADQGADATGRTLAAAAPQALAERRDALQAAPGAQAAAELPPATAALVTAAATVATGGGEAARGMEGALTGAGAMGEAAPARHADAVADAAPTGAGEAQADQLADQMADQLAEQVTYWVHQKTQSAALTLDRDGRPVEVKVALTGDAAHVTFRSDHAEARHLLDASSAQLRELLQREGLQLAGVTVGMAGGDAAAHSGGQGGAGQEPGRRGARQAAVQAAAPLGAAGGLERRARGVGERSVDIFV